MVFGEIIEPSTRALIDEELEEYPEFTKSVPDWEGSSAVPENIDTLVFVETEKLQKCLLNWVLERQKAISKIKNAGIEIYRLGSNKYLVLFCERKEFTCGEITELFDVWIKTAKQIFSITSESIYNYQNYNLSNRPASIIKMLSTSDKSKKLGYDILESPNLISGLGASVFSYCIHIGIKCCLFVVYMDTSPLDSLNTKPLVKLLKQLDFPLKCLNFKVSPSSSNLYM